MCISDLHDEYYGSIWEVPYVAGGGKHCESRKISYTLVYQELIVVRPNPAGLEGSYHQNCKCTPLVSWLGDNPDQSFMYCPVMKTNLVRLPQQT